MMRLAFLAGAGLGYVLGARAGRKSYEKIKAQAVNLWNDPKVQDGVQKVTDTVSEKAKDVAEAGVDKVKDAAASGVDAAKAKVEDVKESRAEAKAEKVEIREEKKAQKLKDAAPADVISDPATAPEDEGPALS